MFRGLLTLTLVGFFTLAASFSARAADDVISQKERQREAQAETDFTVRRLQTLMRVLEFYQANKSAQKLAMQEMAAVLDGLSKEQMSQVIQQLEVAAKNGEGKSETEVELAYAKNREILDNLKEMMNRYDALQSLDQAADKLDKFSKSQMDLYLSASQVARDRAELADPDLSVTSRFLIERRLKAGKNFDGVRLFNQQLDMQKDIGLLIKQVLELQPKLSDDHKLRVDNMKKYAAELNLADKLINSVRKLRPDATNIPAEKRNEDLAAAIEIQSDLAQHYGQMARILRLPGDTLAALEEARARIDEEIRKQDEINEATKPLVKEEPAKVEVKKNEPAAKDPADPKDAPKGVEAKNDPAKDPAKDVNPLEVKAPKDTKPADTKTALQKATEKAETAEKNNELVKKQAQLQFDTKDTENLLKPIAKDAAKKLEDANKAMKDAKNALAKNEAKEAVKPQEKAKADLVEARKEIEAQIEKIKKEKNDPLVALQKAAEKLDKLIGEQEKNRDATKEIAKDDAKKKELPEATAKQKELARDTAELKDTPLPGKEKIEAALEKAEKAMKEAIKDLVKKEAEPAVPKQDKAVEALKEARKELNEKIAEIEKNRDDLAKLEKAAEKLAELANKEKNVAKEADKNEAKDKNQKLANEQKDLTPPTKELAKEIADAAPEAAKKVEESTGDMAKAQDKLEKNDAKPAAKDAKEAAKKLDEAGKELAKAIDKLKAKEIADQAALQPNKIDPMAAAQQVAKALEQTEKAAVEAKKAEDMAKEQGDLAKDLAKKQGELAKEAEMKKLPEAAKDAKKAADALEKGDLKEAVKAQKDALAKLDKAPGEPMPAEPKAGEPKAGEPKQGEPKEGEPKAGEPKAPAEAKGDGEPKDGKKGEGKGKGKGKGQGKGEGKGDGMAKAPMPGEKGPMAQAKGAPMPGEPMPGEPMAGEPGELAKKQDDLLKATQQLANLEKSKEATEAAMNALAQAQAQAPKQVQEQLKNAGEQLAKAGENLKNAAPADAAEAQMAAAKELGKALDALNAALQAMNQQPVQPGEPSEAQAKAGEPMPGEPMPGEGKEPGMGEGKEPGMGEGKEGMGEGKEPGMGEGKGPGKGPGKEGKPGQPSPLAKGEKGKGDEKNEPEGAKGDREADGKVSNAKSQLGNVNGDGSFLHLPPRQRELIRQALSGQLPPEYSSYIQQYYINVARGRPAGSTAPQGK